MNEVTCKPRLQLLALVGNNVVVGRYEGAAGAMQADLESTVSVCGDTQRVTREVIVAGDVDEHTHTHSPLWFSHSLTASVTSNDSHSPSACVRTTLLSMYRCVGDVRSLCPKICGQNQRNVALLLQPGHWHVNKPGTL